MEQNKSEEQLIRMLLDRLERISADSYWAHHASGVRGGLLRALEVYEGGGELDAVSLRTLLSAGFMLLEKAAREKGR